MATPHVSVFIDGGCDPNPDGVATFAWYLEYNDRIIVEDYGVCADGPGATNNTAEYHALLQALAWLRDRGERIRAKGTKITIYADSQLIVRQVRGEWACGAEKLIPLHARAVEVMATLPVTIEWIPRAKNEYADSLCRRAYAQYMTVEQHHAV